ncbi:unnamed protein product [Cuscuta epithymum]|uniref:DUF4283 domain-containing protein n=1 Tax=Cuscuta epithymum TaxID=186058 RepID=A0AAV0FI80_9ASTE|nr:unnamed protein product [Cuscuta epithymum]
MVWGSPNSWMPSPLKSSSTQLNNPWTPDFRKFPSLPSLMGKGRGNITNTKMPNPPKIDDDGKGPSAYVKPVTYVLTANKTSWAGLFKDNRAPSKGMKLRYIPTEGDFVDMSIEEPINMVEVWGFCLVGFFTGRFPGIKSVYKLMDGWDVRCKLLQHSRGWFVFQFKTDEDRTRVLLDGPYDVAGRMLMLKELSEGFSFEDEEFLKVPLWVKFPRYPMECWNEEKINIVASKVAQPIYTDGVTNEKTKLDYARVLIEVDISKPPPLSVKMRMRSGKNLVTKLAIK